MLGYAWGIVGLYRLGHAKLGFGRLGHTGLCLARVV
jgi:hypothetical protein